MRVTSEEFDNGSETMRKFGLVICLKRTHFCFLCCKSSPLPGGLVESTHCKLVMSFVGRQYRGQSVPGRDTVADSAWAHLYSAERAYRDRSAILQAVERPIDIRNSQSNWVATRISLSIKSIRKDSQQLTASRGAKIQSVSDCTVNWKWHYCSASLCGATRVSSFCDLKQVNCSNNLTKSQSGPTSVADWKDHLGLHSSSPFALKPIAK